MNTSTKYQNSFRTNLFVIPDDTFVISTPVPNSLYQSTGSSRSLGKAYFGTTNNGVVPTVDGLHVRELYALYSLIGLTWKQLAKLFNVGVRMIHYWIDGERTMAQKHSEILNQLTLFSTKNRLPVFRLRKIFEDYVLNNAIILRRIQTGDLGVYVELEQHVVPCAWNALPVSDEFLLSRLPTDNPFTLMSSGAEQETTPRSGKSRSVKVSRPKKS